MGERATTWAGVGTSSLADPRRAGSDAATVALQGRDAALLVVFCSDSYDLEELALGVHASAGGAEIIGCSTAGEIATDGPGSSGVVVTAIGGPGMSVATSEASIAELGLRGAGAGVAECVAEVSGEHKLLMMLPDGLAGDQQAIVRGAYATVGASVPLVGGCAGDDLKMTQTAQIHGASVLRNAVVAAALASDRPFGIGVRHGWNKVGEPMIVTESDGNVVHRLNDRPALDVYLERLNAPPAAQSDPAAFTGFALTHPLGLAARQGEAHVRFVSEADFDSRSLICIAEVRQGVMAWLMHGDASSVLAATDAACAEALAPLDGAPPAAVIAFDCIARKGVLGEEGIGVEIDRIASNAAGAPVAGFYTYGEIARVSGIAGFHNQTLVVLAIG